MGKVTGKIDIVAADREDAERIFYELNQPYILGVENDEPIYNYEGGYICECVLTYQEWLDEGSPETLDWGEGIWKKKVINQLSNWLIR